MLTGETVRVAEGRDAMRRVMLPTMQGCAPALALLIFLTICMLPLASSALAQQAGDTTSRTTAKLLPREVRIGVLAYRGVEHATRRWEPLIACLNARLPAWRFRLVRMTLESATELLSRQALDFLITNPGHYVALARRFNLSALATLTRFTEDGQPVLRFGSVIFTRADHPQVEDLADARSHTVAAVSERAFGGFLVGWREFRRLGIDLLDGGVHMYFTGFPQDRIVDAVLKGKADIGIVRTGLLESMVREGRLDMKRIRILHEVPQAGFPWKVSSRLYPEWPFVARDGVSRGLAGQVLEVLLRMRLKSERQTCGLQTGWAPPLSYVEVERLLAEFDAAARERADGGRDWLLWVALLAVGFAAFLAAWAWRQRQAEELRLRASVAEAGVLEAGGVSPVDKARFEDLTRRELQVLACLCEGLSSKEIARRLGIAPKTVEYHRANLLKKTGFANTTKMVSIAARLGLDACPGKTPEKTSEAPDGET